MIIFAVALDECSGGNIIKELKSFQKNGKNEDEGLESFNLLFFHD